MSGAAGAPARDVTMPPMVTLTMNPAVDESASVGVRHSRSTPRRSSAPRPRGGVFLVEPSPRETRELTGEGSGDEKGVSARAARGLVGRGAREALVLSLGSGGARWTTQERQERLVSPPVPASSSVGAGDGMAAGIVLSLARGLALPEAVRFGVAGGGRRGHEPGDRAVPARGRGTALWGDGSGVRLTGGRVPAGGGPRRERVRPASSMLRNTRSAVPQSLQRTGGISETARDGGQAARIDFEKLAAGAAA